MYYKIANIIVKMNPKYEPLSTQSIPYLTNDNSLNDLTFSNNELNVYHKEFNLLSKSECEYMLYGSKFYNLLIDNNGLLLHSSCVVYQNYAYLFSAPSGTGKSTHTNIWVNHFKGAFILNDDKPAIKIENNKIIAYGTPFSGKTDLNVNAGYVIKAIIFLERGKTNQINKMNNNEAIYNILSQTIRPNDESKMEQLLIMIDQIIKEIPIYKLKCNISTEAAILTYNTINEENNG